MRIGLVDHGGKITNLAIMKISSFHKAQGDEVVLNPSTPEGLDKTFVSIIFAKDKAKAVSMYKDFPDVTFGGTGYDISSKLPVDIEAQRPDYDLYRWEDIFPRISSRVAKKENVIIKAQEIVNAGIGFITRGCVNTAKTCPWCVVPVKEGAMHRVNDIADLINPRSNRVIVLDNSLPAHPDALEILTEIRDRKLVVDITQGIDVRRLTPEIAIAISQIKHWRSVHYAWDLISAEKSVLRGISMLSEFVTKSKHLCYLLCGFNSTFEEDMHRILTLRNLGIRPYVMKYQQPDDTYEKSDARTEYSRIRLNHLARWVNAPAALYKTVPFKDYSNWMAAQAKMIGAYGATQQTFEFAV